MATDREVLLYRSKRSDLASLWQAVLVVLALAYVLVSVDAVLLAGVMAAGTVFLIGAAHGMEKRGRIRSMYERLPWIEYTYPPLNEWEDRLEADGALEVDYGD
jgi:hypothetical protein